jgi:hypothetical protein
LLDRLFLIITAKNQGISRLAGTQLLSITHNSSSSN